MNGTTAKNTAPYVVAVLISAFLITIAYVMFFVPKINESKALVVAAETARTGNAALIAKKDRIETIAGNLDPLKAQVGKFSTAFPFEARQQEMMDAITAAASASGVQLTTLNPNAPVAEGADATAPVPAAPALDAEATPETGQAPAQDTAVQEPQLGTVSLKIDGKGSLGAVQDFITRIEGLKRPVMVKELQIQKMEGVYHVMITGDTFLSAPLVEPGAGEADAEGPEAGSADATAGK